MTEWFEEWFGEEYLRLYPHRDDAEAERAVALIAGTVPFEPGWRVLDVACGAGPPRPRLSTSAGARCIGLDLSATLLRLARQVTDAPLVRADMRQLPIRPGSMDLTVNLFTSFGYFERDAEHTAALAEMISTVRPGGWFVIDFLNPAAVRRELVPEETRGARTARPIAGLALGVARRAVRVQEHPVAEGQTLQGAGSPVRAPTRWPPCSERPGWRYSFASATTMRRPLTPISARTILVGQVG